MDVQLKDTRSGQKYRRNITHLKKVVNQWEVTDNTNNNPGSSNDAESPETVGKQEMRVL